MITFIFIIKYTHFYLYIYNYLYIFTFIFVFTFLLLYFTLLLHFSLLLLRHEHPNRILAPIRIRSESEPVNEPDLTRSDPPDPIRRIQTGFSFQRPRRISTGSPNRILKNRIQTGSKPDFRAKSKKRDFF